ncbi:MAG TPA: DUF3011 domain-containing protein [Candidatus Competibacter sp.]|nr:DUF3011 domain-containing protein [Candidatus Competibacter sp.]
MSNDRHLTARRTTTWMALFLTTSWGGIASADETVVCASDNNRYRHCPTSTHGYVTMVRQLSNSLCQQGKTWDYDRRGIWVDDGCRAKFRIESDDRSKDSSKDAKVAAGVILGAAILGAVLSNNKDHDDGDHYDSDSKYNDDAYHGSRHTSYVPEWMVGTFRGHNPLYNADVVMTIQENGRVRADANGQIVTGYINDERLHVGNAIFDINRVRGGFVTSQEGNRQNEVVYRRTRD